MKAIEITHNGGPDVLIYTDVPTPELKPGTVRVKLESIGVNYMDVYTRIGLYGDNVPIIPGGEGAGIVTEFASDVNDFNIGDSVAYTGVSSSYAEEVVAPADQLVKLPSGISTDIGAATMLQGTTAHYLLYSTFPVKDDDTILVHAGAGGVGLLMIQIARMIGCKIITTVSNKEKAQLAKNAGADHIILYTETDFLTEVQSITNGQGVQVAYDSVGLTTYEKSLASLAPRGYLVLFGQSSGVVPPISPLILNKGSNFLTRPALGHYLKNREELNWRTGDLFEWIKKDRLSIRIHEKIPLKDARKAHEDLESRKTSGKLLLIP
ncbi:MAG: quinone oxidoreductase [Chloroflexota bacterium]|nr:quinone oxidoreductase [Chloroflexota bacterium]